MFFHSVVLVSDYKNTLNLLIAKVLWGKLSVVCHISSILLKPFDGFRCHLASTFVCCNDSFTCCKGDFAG